MTEKESVKTREIGEVTLSNYFIKLPVLFVKVGQYNMMNSKIIKGIEVIAGNDGTFVGKRCKVLNSS